VCQLYCYPNLRGELTYATTHFFGDGLVDRSSNIVRFGNPALRNWPSDGSPLSGSPSRGLQRGALVLQSDATDTKV
jgi:hypothetical protein